MKLDVELLEITRDNQAEAQFMASSLIDEDLKNRVYLNVAGSEAVSYHLQKFGVNVSEVNHIHSMKRVIQKVDIADIILPNIHIDVRVIFDDKKIFIPKAHFDLGIVPDIYVVLKYVNSTERIYLLGFFEPSSVELIDCDENYYLIDSSKLRSPFEMEEFIRNFNHKTESALTQDQILRGRELSVAVSDYDVTDEEFKEFLSLLLKSNVLRGSVLEYDNFETLASKVAAALRVKISKKALGASVVGVDDFMNLDSPAEADSSVSPQGIGVAGIESLEDVNGDDLLDSEVLPNSDLTQEDANIEDILVEDENSVSSIDDEQVDINIDNLDIDNQVQNSTLMDGALEPESAVESSEFASISDISEDSLSVPIDFELNNDNTDSPDIDIQGNEDSFEADLVTELPEQDVYVPDSSDQGGKNNVAEFSETGDSGDLVPEDKSLDSAEDNAVESELNNDIIGNEAEVNPVDESSQISEKGNINDNGIETSESDSINSFTIDEDGFDMKDIDLDFSDFEEDMSDQASDNFIEDNSNGENDVANNSETIITVDEEIHTPADNSYNDDAVPKEETSDSANNLDEPQDSNISVAGGGDVSLTDLNLNKSESEGLLNIQDENLDTDIKDFDELREVSEQSPRDDVSMQHYESNNDNLVDFSELSAMPEAVSDNNVFENPKNEGDDLSDIMSNLDENTEINRDNNSRLDQEDELFSDNLVDITLEDNGDEVIDIESNDQNIQDFDTNENNIENVISQIPSDEILDQTDLKDADFSIEDDMSESTGNSLDEHAEIESSEVSFDEFASLDDIETAASVEQNVEGNFLESELANNELDENVISHNGGVIENSVVISDQNLTPGEIFIDINKDNSGAGSYENEHLEELYSSNGNNDDSGLNNEVRIVPQKSKKPIPLIAGIGGLAVLVVIVGIILFSVSKYVNPASTKDAKVVQADDKPAQNDLGTDVPKTKDSADKGKVVMSDSPAQKDENKADNKKVNSDTKTASAAAKTPAHIPSTAFLSVNKLTWEIPDYISYNEGFKQYFQSSGKSIKAALTSDLLLATDYTYSDQVRVSISFDRTGNFSNAKILLSSGSSQVDNIVLQSVNQTLKVLKAPPSLGNDQSTTVILKIYF